MKLESKIGKLLTLVAATSAGFAIAFPGKTLAHSLDNLNSPTGNLVSQGAPADAPPATPGNTSPAETPPPTDTPPADAPPVPPSDTSPAETPPPTDTPPADAPPADAPPAPSSDTPATETAPSTETPSAPRSSAPEKGSWACLNNPNPACR